MALVPLVGSLPLRDLHCDVCAASAWLSVPLRGLGDSSPTRVQSLTTSKPTDSPTPSAAIRSEVNERQLNAGAGYTNSIVLLFYCPVVLYT